MHPSLFTAICMLDPVMEENEIFPTDNPIVPSSKRLDIWPSMAEVERYIRSRPFYKTWDPRAVELHLVRIVMPVVSFPIN
jgi:hypothetical protein